MGCLSSKESPKLDGLETSTPITGVVTTPGQRKGIEAKIIAHAKTIRNLVKPPSESKLNSKPQSEIEEKVKNCFKEITSLAKKTNALDGSVLNEILMACNTLRISNPELAHNVLYISQTAKKVVEDRTVADEEITTPGGSSLSSSAGKSKTLGGILKTVPAIMVTQVPREDCSKSTSEGRLQKLTSDGLPPLKNFNKKKPDYADGSQHSGDFGFFDLSVHDRTGMPEWTGVMPPTIDDASPKMPKKMVYSVSQLNVANCQ
jgi:hypothetical protein